MALTKIDIVDSIRDQFSFSKRQSFETIETLLEIMKKTLGNPVKISWSVGLASSVLKRKQNVEAEILQLVVI